MVFAKQPATPFPPAKASVECSSNVLRFQRDGLRRCGRPPRAACSSPAARPYRLYPWREHEEAAAHSAAAHHQCSNKWMQMDGNRRLATRQCCAPRALPRRPLSGEGSRCCGWAEHLLHHHSAIQCPPSRAGRSSRWAYRPESGWIPRQALSKRLKGKHAMPRPVPFFGR